jgi:hypothetical protein
MNTNLYDREGFVLKELPIRTEEDRHACLRMLLENDRHRPLCHSEYSEEHIRAYVENGTAFLYYHPVDDIETMVCFAIVKQKKRVLDILLVCAAPNTHNFDNMIVHAIYTYSISKKCKKLYAAPRTERLRTTFMRYGFTHLRGTRGIDEVFEKTVGPLSIPRVKYTRRGTRNHTRRNRRPRDAIQINERRRQINAGNFTNV